MNLREEYKEDFALSEAFRSKYIEFVSDKEEVVFVEASDAASRASSSGGARSVTLPKLSLPNFSGDPRQWINFWAGFEVIHRDDMLTQGQKLQYLRQCVSDSAKNAVFSFPPSPENYEKAVDHLKQGFGRQELLINIYAREMIDIVLTVLTKSERGLENLYDSIISRLRATSSYLKKSIFYDGLSKYNKLRRELKCSASVHQFKKLLIKIL